MIQVAGIGPGSIDQMTLEVYHLIQSTETVLAFGRVGKSISSIRQDVIQLSKVADILNTIENKADVLILASGDPMFFGIVKYLKEKGLEIDRVLPGVSSFQYLMSKIQVPWQEAHFFSFHGRPFEVDSLLRHPINIGFVDRETTPTMISKTLASLGVEGRIIVGHYLSYAGKEVIEDLAIGEPSTLDQGLAVVVVMHEVD